MRIGRVGVFQTPDGGVGLAAVVAILGNDSLVAKTTSGQLVQFDRGEIHILDSCGSNSNAADLVRNQTGITVGGRELSGNALEGVIKLSQLSLGGGVSTPSSVAAVSGEEVHISPTVLQAIRQVVKSLLHKKKPSPVQFVRASRSSSKTNKSTSRSRSSRGKKSSSKGSRSAQPTNA